jgi:hypothetical protein
LRTPFRLGDGGIQFTDSLGKVATFPAFDNQAGSFHQLRNKLFALFDAIHGLGDKSRAVFLFIRGT